MGLEWDIIGIVQRGDIRKAIGPNNGESNGQEHGQLIGTEETVGLSF